MVSSHLLDIVGNIMFITFPILGYVPQIIRKRILFAPILSVMTVCCNLLKLFYWKANDMPTAIVCQSLLLVFFHIILLYNNKSELSVVEEKIVERSRLNDYYKKYGLFLVTILFFLTVIISLAMVSLLLPSACILWGHLAIILESSVGLVQLLILNMDNRYEIPASDLFKIEKRFPKELYLCWALGDVLKLMWMFHIKSPWLFFASVVFQILVDLFLVFAH